MNTLIRSIEAEYRRYKALAEAAIAQVPEADTCPMRLAGPIGAI